MKNLIILLSLACPLLVYSQSAPIDVTESKLKIAGLGEEFFYCGLCEGDQLVFNFQEVNGKELKEIEIIELPSSSKFMDYKTERIENKTLSITRTGIYKFRFSNSAIMGRVCKYKVQRIPASDATRNFNTNVYWRTVYDTTYTTEQEKYLVKSDTTISNVTDQIVKVHSGGNLNGNKTTLNFTLPPNTIGWSYYIGVDQTGQAVYQKATAQLQKTAGPILLRLPGYGPLAALVLGGATYLSQLQNGEDIDYYFVTGGENANQFSSGQQFYYFKKSKVINDYSKMMEPLSGMHFLCLHNDNAITGVEVSVKITAVCVTKQWGMRPIQKMHVSSREEPYLQN